MSAQVFVSQSAILYNIASPITVVDTRKNKMIPQESMQSNRSNYQIHREFLIHQIISKTRALNIHVAEKSCAVGCNFNDFIKF
jgi:hypothetical protein